MSKNGIEIKKSVTLSFTADQYQLFFKDGRDEAAMEINLALETAINAGLDRRECYSAATKVCSKYSKLGAYDSEPLWLIENTLDKVFGDDDEIEMGMRF